METRGIPRALLAVGAVALAVLAGIGTAGSFGDSGSLWGDHYDPAGSETDAASRDEAVLRAPAIRAAVDSVIAMYGRALTRGDLDRAAISYASDAVSSWPGERAAEGRRSIRSSLERSFSGDVSLELSSVEIQVLGPEWASAYGRAGLAQSPAEEGRAVDDGADARAQPVTFFALLRKTGDGWKVVREAVSSNR